MHREALQVDALDLRVALPVHLQVETQVSVAAAEQLIRCLAGLLTWKREMDWSRPAVSATWAEGWNCTLVSRPAEGRALLTWRHFFTWTHGGVRGTLGTTDAKLKFHILI